MLPFFLSFFLFYLFSFLLLFFFFLFSSFLDSMPLIKGKRVHVYVCIYLNVYRHVHICVWVSVFLYILSSRLNFYGFLKTIFKVETSRDHEKENESQINFAEAMKLQQYHNSELYTILKA